LCKVFRVRVRPEQVPDGGGASCILVKVNDGAGTVAGIRAENIADDAARVHPHQRWLAAVLDCAQDHREMGFAVDFGPIRNHAECAATRRNQRPALALDAALVRHTVPDQLGDRKQLQVVPITEGDQVRHSRHGAIVILNFADYRGRYETCEPGQVYRSLRLAGAHQYATLAGSKWKYVAGAGEVFRARGRIDCG
jgi:hypothetical protein